MQPVNKTNIGRVVAALIGQIANKSYPIFSCKYNKLL